MSTKTIGAGVLIVTPEGKFLTIQEKVSQEITGKQVGMRSFPIETVEEGEREEEALIRLFHEEFTIRGLEVPNNFTLLDKTEIKNKVWLHTYILQIPQKLSLKAGWDKEVGDPRWMSLKEVFSNQNISWRLGVKEAISTYFRQSSMGLFINYLKTYNQQAKPMVEELFNREKVTLGKIAPMTKKLIDDYKNFLMGGKMLRGCEIVLGYEIFGGKKKKEVLLASLVIEIIHSFLLIHDDIMDQDFLRRGKPTMHKIYEKEFDSHYGVSMAIDMGDEGMFFAMRILNELNFPPQRIVFATRFLNELLMEVGLGQALDITYEHEKNYTEENVLRVHRYKTANYTIPGPISIGAILAGADEKDLRSIKDFGIPVGIAFQLRDDELGMFSTEEELGKPVDSDLRENKVTILIVKAFELAKEEDLKFLKYAYGNKNLTTDEVEKVREIMIKVGALDYSQKLSRKLVEKGKKFIPQITSDPKYQKLLSELADFVIERKS